MSGSESEVPRPVQSTLLPSYPWSTALQITSPQTDVRQWENDWVRAIDRVTKQGPVELFQSMCKLWDRCGEREREHVVKMRSDLAKLQKQVVLWFVDIRVAMGCAFEEIWMLLNDGYRRYYISEGLLRAGSVGHWEEEARVLCPELTEANLALPDGQAMIDFMYHAYLEACRTRDSGSDVFLVANPWWDMLDVYLGRPLPEKENLVLDALAIIRNQYISEFVYGWLENLVHDIAERQESMPFLTHLFRRDPVRTAKSVINTPYRITAQSDSSSMYCAGCVGTRKEFEKSGRFHGFLRCALCKDLLGPKDVYCSKQCQISDWPRHRHKCQFGIEAQKLWQR